MAFACASILFSMNSAIAFKGLLCESAMMRIAFQSSPIRSLPLSLLFTFISGGEAQKREHLFCSDDGGVAVALESEDIALIARHEIVSAAPASAMANKMAQPPSFCCAAANSAFASAGPRASRRTGGVRPR